MLFLTGNDLGPRGALQVAFGAFADLMGAIMIANLFGELAVLVAELNQRSTEFQKKVDTANTAMQNMRLPNDIQNTVLAYLRATQQSHAQQQELKEFYNKVSPSLQSRITHSVFHVVIKSSTLISKQLGGGNKELEKELDLIGRMF